MTSVDSGVETGNDSNDSPQVKNQPNQMFNNLFELNDKQVQLIPTKNNQIVVSESNYNNYALVSSMPSSASPIINCLPNISDNQFHEISFLRMESKGRDRDQMLEISTKDKDDPLRRLKGCQKVKRRTFSYSSSFFRLCRKILGDEKRMRLAAATNNIEMMTWLLQTGVSPNIQDQQGRSPLHLASCRGYTEMVQLLLSFGANPNQRDCLGNTPLHLAAVASKISVVTLLLKAGTDVLSSDQHGYNPLQLAQTKLRMLQNSKGSNMNVIKEEVHKVVDMLLIYLNKQKDISDQIETLASFCSKISLSNTSHQVQDDVKDLLANIQSLNLSN